MPIREWSNSIDVSLLGGTCPNALHNYQGAPCEARLATVVTPERRLRFVALIRQRPDVFHGA